MKRLLITAAAITVTLTACENDILKPHTPSLLVHWFLSVGMSSGEVLNPLDGGNIGQTLEAEWIKQSDVSRFEGALELAEEIIDECPDLIDLSISWISRPGYFDGRPAASGDGCGGYMEILMGILESSDLTYIIQGKTLTCEEVFSITTLKGEEVLFTVRVMSYYLRLKRPAAAQSNSGITQFAEPRWDPPAMLEKRAGSRPGG